MDQREHVDAAGNTKRPFASKEIAKRTIRRYRGHGRSGADQFFPYRCSVCAAWHLGRHHPNKVLTSEDKPLLAIARVVAERNRAWAKAWAREQGLDEADTPR